VGSRPNQGQTSCGAGRRPLLSLWGGRRETRSKRGASLSDQSGIWNRPWKAAPFTQRSVLSPQSMPVSGCRRLRNRKEDIGAIATMSCDSTRCCFSVGRGGGCVRAYDCRAHVRELRNIDEVGAVIRAGSTRSRLGMSAASYRLGHGAGGGYGRQGDLTWPVWRGTPIRAAVGEKRDRSATASGRPGLSHFAPKTDRKLKLYGPGERGISLNRQYQTKARRYRSRSEGPIRLRQQVPWPPTFRGTSSDRQVATGFVIRHGHPEPWPRENGGLEIAGTVAGASHVDRSWG